MKSKLRKDLFDFRITQLVGKNIYFLHAPKPSDVYVEYQIYNEKLVNWYDNDNHAITYYIQVDIFSKEDYEELEKTIRAVLKQNNYNFITGVDLWESDTNLYHKAMRFTYTEIIER